MTTRCRRGARGLAIGAAALLVGLLGTPAQAAPTGPTGPTGPAACPPGSAPGVPAGVLDVPCAGTAAPGPAVLLPKRVGFSVPPFPFREPPLPSRRSTPGPHAASRWAADLDRRDVVAAGFADNSANRELADGKFDNPTLPWPIPTVPAPGGRPGRAVAYTLPDDAIRLEAEPNHKTFLSGDDAWFGFSFYLDRAFPLDTREFQVIEQLHAAPNSGSPPVGFQAAKGALLLDGGWGKPGEADPTRFAYQMRLADIRTAQWYDVVYHVHFSTTAAHSVVDVYLDGIPVLLGFHPPGGTVYPPTPHDDRVGTYRKEGLYHSAKIRGGTLYEAGQRLGRSFLEAYPRPRSGLPALPGAARILGGGPPG